MLMLGVVKRTIPSSSREQPSHFDIGGGMQSEFQHHFEPPVSVPSCLQNQQWGNRECHCQQIRGSLLRDLSLPTQGDALITTNFVGGRFQRNMDDIVEIPSSCTSRCPNLLMLLLGDNQKLERIGNSFFEQFHKLKVLDLSGCSEIEKLPNSVSTLVNLTDVLLSGCYELRHVPSLAKLGELKMLVLFGCHNVEEMPEGVGSLSKLKYLDLSGSGIREIPGGIISILSGLGRLRKLETLECHFQHVSEFTEYIESRRECGKSLSEYLSDREG